MAMAPLQLPVQSVRVSRWSVDFGSIIGSGTFGSVYMARDEEGSGELVAAKVIYASRMRWAKIWSEVRLLSKVAHHEGIIGLHGAHEVANANGHCVVMLLELGTGGDLLELITRNVGVLAEAEALRYFREIAGAVEFLHTQRIAHRDLKLENVLIGAGGSCKIADFGLAHEYVGELDFGPRPVPGRPNEYVGAWSEREVLYDVCGSPSYVAPEVLLKLGYDGYAADVWSLGICLFAMLTGSFPFTEAVAHDADYAVAHKQAAAHGSLTLAVFQLYRTPCPLSPRAVELIDHLLRISPVRRSSAADALAFARAAEAVLDGQLAPAVLQPAAAALPPPLRAPPSAHHAPQGPPSSCSRDSVSPMLSPMPSILSVSSCPSYWIGVAGESALDPAAAA
jgi:serine/threonine protein kinase